MAELSFDDLLPKNPSGGLIDPRSRDLAIRTILAEADSQGDEGIAGVANVMRNRVQAGRYGGNNIDAVIKKPWAFEPTMTERGRARMQSYSPESPLYQRAGEIFDQVFSGSLPDNTGGSTHFIVPGNLGRTVPSWAQGEPVTKIRGHAFYAPEGRVNTGVGNQAMAYSATKKPADNLSFDDLIPGDGRIEVRPSSPAKEIPMEVGPQAPDEGALSAAGRGFGQGITFNFLDELVALGASRGVDESVLSGIIKYVTGDQGAVERYNAAANEERFKNKTAQEQHPIASTVGNVAGALAVPIGGMANAATLPARIGRGAAIGAGVGTVAGAGEGEGAIDTGTRALTGLGIGAAVGGAAAPVVEGVVQAGRAVARPMINAVRGAVNPEAEAGRRVMGALQRDAANDPQAVSRLTPAEMAASGDARVMDMGGETTRALARSAANTSTEGRALLNRTIDDRFEAQTGRVSQWFNQTFHYPNAHAQQQAIEQAARAANNPAYLRAYRSQNAQGMWDQDLANLAQAPDVQNAIRMATSTASNNAVGAGVAPVRNPFVVDPATGRMTLRQGPNGQTALPNLQFWDQVKRNLDQIGSFEARALSRSLRTHLDSIVPEYGAARAGAAHFFGAENALEAGQNFVTQNFGIRETRQALANMTPTERQLFQDGFVSRFIDTINKTGDRRNVLNQIAASPAAREKLEVAIGPQRSAELETVLRVEGIMDLARGAVQGNSTTARQLAELGFAGGAGTVGATGAYNLDPQQMTYAALAGALLAGKKGIDTRVSLRVAQMLVSPDPRVLARGVMIGARNQRILEALRSVDRRLAQVGGQQSSMSVPAIQSPAIGRAEQEQPAVPGPVGQ